MRIVILLFFFCISAFGATTNSALKLNYIAADTNGVVRTHTNLIFNPEFIKRNAHEGVYGLSNSSIAIGQGAGASWQSTDLYNVAIGIDALKNSTGNGQNVEYPGDGGFNVAVGNNALKDATTAFSCTAVGYQAGEKITTGYSNTGLGRSALAETTTGIYNTAVGYQALYGNVQGSANTAVGLKSLASLVGGSGINGYGNTALGWNAGHGFNDTDENSVSDGFCTFIGFQASRDLSVSRNTPLLFSTAIGANAKVSRSYAIVLGGTGAYQQNVGIKTTDPIAPLNVGKISNNYSGQSDVIFASEDKNKAALMLSNWTGDYTTNGVWMVFDNSTRGQWSVGSSAGANSYDVCRTWGTPDYRIDASGNSLFSNEINVTKAARFRFHQYLLNKAEDGWLPFAVRNTSGSDAVYDLSNVGTLDISGSQYSHSSHFILNKAGNGWLQFATRNTTGADAVMDLANVGTVSAAHYYGDGSNLTGLVPFSNPTFTGTLSASALILSGTAYLQGSGFVLNKASNSWLSLFVRDTSGSEVKYNLESIGNINAATAAFTGSVSSDGGNSGQWNTAYGWGNHANVGYALSQPEYDTQTLGDGSHRNYSAHIKYAYTDNVWAKGVTITNGTGGLYFDSGSDSFSIKKIGTSLYVTPATTPGNPLIQYASGDVYLAGTANLTVGNNIRAAGNYIASDYSAGITQTETIAASGGTNWTFTIKNGLITGLTHAP